MSNPRTALADYLKTNLTSASPTEGRIFRPELPKDQDEQMPRACVVIFAGGGGHMMGANQNEAFDSIMDLVCYGSTRLEAETVAEEMQQLLRELRRHENQGVLLHWARIAGGLKSAIDQDTQWPLAMITVQVLHSFP